MHRRTEGPTRHRPRIVEFAQARRRIEHWTGLIVGKFREATFRFRSCFEHCRVERARFRITWKLRRQSLYRILRTRPNALRPLPVRLFERGQPLLEPRCIKSMNRKHAYATLRASRAARQPRSAASRCISQRGVDDLN
jgi:hypothetical protein